MAPKKKAHAKVRAKGKAKKQSAEEIEARNKILEEFRTFDLNGDNLLQKGELKALLKVLDPTRWTDDAVDRLITAFDKDGDGDVSLEEFVDWITGSTDADHEAFTETLEKQEKEVASLNRKHVQGELEHIKGIDIAAEIQKISERDLRVIDQIASPPEPLLRMFALVYLILQPSTTRTTGKPVNFTPPGWPVLQHLIRDSSFIQRICQFEHRQKEMNQSHTMVGLYAVDQFFCLPESGEECTPPLSYASLLEASQSHKLGKASSVMLIYKWCLALLEPKLRPIARDTLREQASHTLKEIEVEERNKEIESVCNRSGELLDELESFLAAA